MTIFFISDLHLSEKSPNSYKLFVNFFNSMPHDTQAVYILGDLFESWVGDNLNTEFISNVKNILATASNKIPIYFIRGNRDFLIGTRFAKETKVTILPDFYKVNLYGHNLLLVHGDYLCTLDKRHHYFSKIIRHPIVICIANILTIKLKLFIAEKLRKTSKDRYKTNKNPKIYDVCQSTIEQVAEKYSTDILIHGHTHKPNIHNFIINNKNITRIVLGSWEETAQILKFEQNGYKLETI